MMKLIYYKMLLLLVLCSDLGQDHHQDQHQVQDQDQELINQALKLGKILLIYY